MVVIEHNLDVIKTADRLIDLGPEGGEEGGEVVATGTPEEVAAAASSYTGPFLAELVEPAEPEAGYPAKAGNPSLHSRCHGLHKWLRAGYGEHRGRKHSKGDP